MSLTIKNDLHSNPYLLAQFRLTLYFNLILVILLPILSVFLYLLNEPAAFPTLIGFLACTLVYVNLKIKKNHLFAAKALSIIGLILCQYTLIYFSTAYHFVDTMWIMVIVLYTYFTLGKIWGSTLLFANILGVSFYILFVLKDNIQNLKPLEQQDLIALTLNFIICTVLISYMMFQFIKLNKNAEKQYIQIANSLKDKNKEKTVLLKEVHHRVKNNLQVIISLLRLQLQDLDDESLEKPYNESINRVMAMSLIHEKIYQSSDLAKIDLKNYIESLIRDLIHSYELKHKIVYNIETDIININIKNLVPMALLLNELISNSIIHGLKHTNNGNISVKIWELENDLHIHYTDNGTWVKSAKTGTLGLELISSLTEQMNGTFERKIENGTAYKFQFTALSELI
ncbi:hypothetical protein DNU06_12175 [Putridiphycobacter roseus]|uniref:histidine kinase n=1 Tax=Putridiphycobacter roseus TaxID=2219161 RepID=A0A2W1MYY4_9FLAO|nr:sensor histidine kinase [Putridiphycobacter roseus]PZE16604.1 hypothetical protein DNU06_12175 [Putridiphycobacter roseus]